MCVTERAYRFALSCLSRQTSAKRCWTWYATVGTRIRSTDRRSSRSAPPSERWPTESQLSPVQSTIQHLLSFFDLTATKTILSEMLKCGDQHRRQRGVRGLAPHKKNCPLSGAVARVFPNVSLAMCPLPQKLSLAPYLLYSGAGTGGDQTGLETEILFLISMAKFWYRPRIRGQNFGLGFRPDLSLDLGLEGLVSFNIIDNFIRTRKHRQSYRHVYPRRHSPLQHASLATVRPWRLS